MCDILNNYCYNETTFNFPNNEIYTLFLGAINNNLLLTFNPILSNEILNTNKEIYNVEVIEKNNEELRIQILFDTILTPPMKFYEKIFAIYNIKVTTLYYNLFQEYYGILIFSNNNIYCKEYDFPNSKKKLKKIQSKLFNENYLLYDFMKDIFEDMYEDFDEDFS